MRQVRSLGFDALEARQLLTKAHHGVAHAAAVQLAAPLILQGTLAVDHKTASTSTNDDGSMTTSTPVSGVLGTLSKVRGDWNESTDSIGDYSGPDTLQLRNSKEAFVITFNTANLGKAEKTAQGFVFKPIPQHVAVGSGAYARAAESGTIQIGTSAKGKVVQNMTLATGES